MRTLSNIFAGLAVAAGLLLPAAGASATQSPADATPAPSAGTTWSVAPATAEGKDGRRWFDLDVDPGEAVREFVEISNLGNDAATFALSAADGYLTDRGRFNMLSRDQESVGAGTWIHLQDTVTVPAGETVTVPVEIDVPSNATPGDHAAGIAASIRSESQGGSSVGVESRVGVRALLRVSGELSPIVTVAAPTLDYQPNLNPFLPGSATVSILVANAGNSQLTITPHAFITGPFGWLERSIALEPLDLLPGATRLIVTDVPAIWPLGAVSANVDASASVPESDVNVPSATAGAWTLALPWTQLLLIVAIAGLIVGATLVRRRERRRVRQLVESARRDGAASVRAASE